MAEKGDDPNKLLYQPFTSVLSPSFWQQLTTVKLNKLKLSKEPIDIYGSYSCSLSDNLPCLASFDHSSFNKTIESGNKSTCPLYGTLICTNTLQELIDFDKKAYINSIGSEIWRAICDGSAIQDPSKYLSRFSLLVFADLKKYDFVYWFSFPALNFPQCVVRNQTTPVPITEIFSEQSLLALQVEYEKPDSDRLFQRSYFILVHDKSSGQINCFPLTSFEEANSIFRQNHDDKTLYFAYTEPNARQVYPGWPLRNYLSLIIKQFKVGPDVNFIRIRKNQAKLNGSMLLSVSYRLNEQIDCSDKSTCPITAGWEKNESQKLLPKRVNLSSLLDPRKLAEDAVNLNLRLMKWRLLPGLDLDKIASTKCLLLGCGTLGCHIARGLLAWGVKNISLVDNSKISYSNPVRQSLYNLDDCKKDGGPVFKAEAAAASLRRIHPTVNVQAHVFSIPMPGHSVVKDETEQTKRVVAKLEELIESHDAIFLLMDTRESRWLPTLISMSKQKCVINAAIGFDTFLLQRFGLRDYSSASKDTILADETSRRLSLSEEQKESSSEANNRTDHQLSSDKLGCYFCNDIVAPGDSTSDRTLDQQCTVSRPGVSMMVSAMAVELLASIACSDSGPRTPAPLDIKLDSLTLEDEDFSSELGIVPHSIRGNLARYHIYMPTSPAFNKCSACSVPVVEAYRTEGYEFLHKVFADPSYLEEVAGLKDLQSVNDDVWALDSDDSVE